MDCRFIMENELHEAYVLQRLDPEQKAAYEAHVRACPACRQAQQREHSLIAGMRQAGHDAMKQELRRQIADARRSTTPRAWSAWLRAAAVLFIFIITPAVIYYAGIDLPLLQREAPSGAGPESRSPEAGNALTAPEQDSGNAAVLSPPVDTARTGVSLLDTGRSPAVPADAVTGRSAQAGLESRQPKAAAAGAAPSEEETGAPKAKATETRVEAEVPAPQPDAAAPPSRAAAVAQDTLLFTTTLEQAAGQPGRERDSVLLRSMSARLQAVTDPKHAQTPAMRDAAVQPLNAKTRLTKSLDPAPQAAGQSDRYGLELRDEWTGDTRPAALRFISGLRTITVTFSDPPPGEETTSWPDAFAVTLENRDARDMQMKWRIPPAALEEDWRTMWIELTGEDKIRVYLSGSPRYMIDLDMTPLRARRVR